MNVKLAIDLDWAYADDRCPPEDNATYAYIRVALGNRVVTRAIDEWSKSVRESVLLSAYPLAEWLASSWWRVRWEPASSEAHWLRRHEWRMSHELAAVGSGFVWPKLMFESDGETVEVRSFATEPKDAEPIQYLESCRATVSGIDFERAIDDFIALVLARLEAVGLPDTDLVSLWQDVREERADPATSHYRRLEAELGFNPDEVPEQVVNDFLNASERTGKWAISEIAAAFSGNGSAASNLKQLLALAEAGEATPGRADWFRSFGAQTALLMDSDQSSGEIGWQLARLFRSELGIQTPIVDDRTLSELLGISSEQLRGRPNVSQKSPIGFAIRTESRRDLSLYFRKRNVPGRRFEAARFIADNLIAPKDDLWLPVTDSKTARQKIQRAFAAGFLCPISDLADFLSGDYSNEAIEDASEQFGVSSLAVESHLASHGLVDFQYS